MVFIQCSSFITRVMCVLIFQTYAPDLEKLSIFWTCFHASIQGLYIWYMEIFVGLAKLFIDHISCVLHFSELIWKDIDFWKPLLSTHALLIGLLKNNSSWKICCSRCWYVFPRGNWHMPKVFFQLLSPTLVSMLFAKCYLSKFHIIVLLVWSIFTTIYVRIPVYKTLSQIPCRANICSCKPWYNIVYQLIQAVKMYGVSDSCNYPLRYYKTI